MAGPYRVRPARPDEAGRLTAIARASKAHWGYPAPWLEAWRDALTFTPTGVEATTTRVAVGPDGVPVACYVLVGAGREVQLEHCWVHPSVIGRGIGRMLVRHAAETARSAGAEALRILSDPNAEPFYARLGAERIGVVRADVCGERRVLPDLRLDIAAAASALAAGESGGAGRSG